MKKSDWKTGNGELIAMVFLIGIVVALSSTSYGSPSWITFAGYVLVLVSSVLGYLNLLLEKDIREKLGFLEYTIPLSASFDRADDIVDQLFAIKLGDATIARHDSPNYEVDMYTYKCGVCIYFFRDRKDPRSSFCVVYYQYTFFDQQFKSYKR